MLTVCWERRRHTDPPKHFVKYESRSVMVLMGDISVFKVVKLRDEKQNVVSQVMISTNGNLEV